MTDDDGAVQWRFVKFHLFVTGEGEQAFLPSFMRSLMASSQCTFRVNRRIGQRSPITSQKRKQYMVGTGQTIPNKDAEQIGFPARRLLAADNNAFVILIDDLERARASNHEDVFNRYSTIFNTMIVDESQRPRAAVHFFVNMVEAYYFAHADAVNGVLGTELSDFEGDVESIPHPKRKLKQLFEGFDEKEHGAQIVKRLDLPHVLSNPETCASLRTMFAWCVWATADESEERFCLRGGKLSPVTKSQIPN